VRAARNGRHSRSDVLGGPQNIEGRVSYASGRQVFPHKETSNAALARGGYRTVAIPVDS